MNARLTQQADRILDRHGAGAMSEDTALRTLTLATGLDEADAAFLLIDRWDARHVWGPGARKAKHRARRTP